MIRKVGSEWIDELVCKDCFLAGSNAPALDVHGGLCMRQRSKKV